MRILWTFVYLLMGALPCTLTGQTVTGSFDFGGNTRDYRLHIPANYTGNTPVPLVFNLHGLTSNATQQEFYSDMNTIADTAGFLVCYGNGINAAWNSGFTQPYFGGVDDVGFISVLIDSLSAQYNIDPARIYSCGMSNGGFMSLRLACELEDRIAAVASVTGTMTTLQTDNCTPSRPMPMLQIHGTLDPTVAYFGNAISLSVDSVVNYWRVANGCTATPVLDTLPDTNLLDGSTVTTQSYTGCQDNVEVLHYKVANGGHTWPGTFPIPAGATNQDINGSEEIWKFFKRFTHPSPVLVGREQATPNRDALQAHPNPFQESFRLEGLKAGTQVEIWDVQGRSMGTFLLDQGKSLHINTPAWPTGVYFLKWKHAEGQGVSRLLKTQ